MTAGRFAERNETGRALPLSPQPLERTVVPDHGKDYAGDPLRNTHAGNTPPLFLWRADTPATDAARRDGIAALRGFQAAIPLVAEFELLPDDASVGAVQYDGQDDDSGERAVYLVNWGRGPCARRPIDTEGAQCCRDDRSLRGHATCGRHDLGADGDPAGVSYELHHQVAPRPGIAVNRRNKSGWTMISPRSLSPGFRSNSGVPRCHVSGFPCTVTFCR